MTAIDAPYNFVPLSDKVVTPEWADQVSHDLPFKDGLSGEIHYTLTAHSPLLVGGNQTKATDHNPGKVEFFKTPDGKYAIPGSSLKGMIRSVLEIATFSRMVMVDDKRYGLRDISGKYVAESYTSRVRNRVQAGFLRLSSKGEPEIVPCEMARFSHRDLEGWWGETKPVFKKGETVTQKYDHWEKLCKKQKISNPFELDVQLSGGDLTAIGTGSIRDGFPVLTGQISDCTNDRRNGDGTWTRGKYHDFIFHSPRDADAFSLHEADPAAWRDFLFIHGDEDGKHGMPWPYFWKDRFWKGERVPVFYIRNGKRLQIGLAFMPKLAGDFSIHCMIGHTSEDHLDDTKADFASLIFGRIGDKPEDALKGRVQFELARIEGQAAPLNPPTAILNSPKPTYFPNYIRQKATPSDTGWKLTGGDKAQYATYLETPAHPRPELRGWKRYPVRPDKEVEVQKPIGDQATNKKIQINLHPLPAGTSFTGRLVFHNLKREELGALLWCLNFGGNAGCRQGLGLGKSFGYGQVGVVVDWSKSCVEPNLPEGETTTTLDQLIDCCLNRFTTYMDQKLGEVWMESPQICALIAMADPAQRDKFKGQLKHMTLARVPDPKDPNRKKTINEFLDAKQTGLALASYIPLAATGHSSPTPSPSGKETWPSVPLSFNKVLPEISAFRNGQTAFVRGSEAKPLLDTLGDTARKLLEKGKLTATITLEHRGGKNWKIVKITP